jgi:hypothetical protein
MYQHFQFTGDSNVLVSSVCIFICTIAKMLPSVFPAQFLQNGARHRKIGKEKRCSSWEGNSGEIVNCAASCTGSVGQLNCCLSSPAQSFLSSGLVEIYDQDVCFFLYIYVFRSGDSSSMRRGVGLAV